MIFESYFSVNIKMEASHLIMPVAFYMGSLIGLFKMPEHEIFTCLLMPGCCGQTTKRIK